MNNNIIYLEEYSSNRVKLDLSWNIYKWSILENRSWYLFFDLFSIIINNKEEYKKQGIDKTKICFYKNIENEIEIFDTFDIKDIEVIWNNKLNIIWINWENNIIEHKNIKFILK